MTHSEHYLYRNARNSPVSRGGQLPEPRTEAEPGMLIERDIEVRLTSGRSVFIDVYRPDGAQPAAPLISWPPYGKHNPAPIGVIYPASGVLPEHTSELTTFEAPDPRYWVPRGYAIVLADIPGTWNSEGPATYCSPEEAADFYDLIEWAGVQEWSSGKVGLSGVSYLTVAQWRVAELSPPHLAAINPWEGWTDTYREVARHGGIPSSFWPYIWERWGASQGQIEDLETESAQHPFYDEFWESKSADLERVTVPAFVVASWADHGLHSRGTLEGFRRISSEKKWLYVHGRKKWAEYYLPDQVERQRAFFDHFLKGVENDVESWPPVTFEVRESYYRGQFREATAWPLDTVEYRDLHLDAATNTLTAEPVAGEAEVSYDGLGNGLHPIRAEFRCTFDEPAEVVGHAKAVLHMTAPAAEDMDVFLALFKEDRDGNIVEFPYFAQFEDGPVAVGWIRASHRELDRARSTPQHPVLAHRRALPLSAHGPTELEIEILPSGTLFEAGETLLLVVQGSDIKRYRKPLVYARHEDTVNNGPQIIHTGGRFDSYLRIPLLK